MTTVTSHDKMDMTNLLEFTQQSAILTSTTSSAMVASDGYLESRYTGSSFVYSSGKLASGTLTGYSVSVGGITLYEITDMSVPVATAFTNTLPTADLLALNAEAIFAAGDTFYSSGRYPEALLGYAGNDQFTIDSDTFSGADTIDGGDGTDTVIYSGNRSDYTASKVSDGVWRISGPQSLSGDFDALTSIERLTFADGPYTLDASGSSWVALTDITAPTVTTFSPADGATGVAATANIVVTFSEAVERGTGNIVLTTAAGATVETFNAASSDRLSIIGSTLTINPTSSLSSSTHYLLTFAAGTIQDLTSNTYAGISSYDFTTGAAGDSLDGTTDNDTSNGTVNDDIINGLAGNDVLNGLAGNDNLDGGIGNDKLSGGDGDDTLDGDDGNDALNGDAGNDVLDGGTGTDKMIGGMGDDTYHVDTKKDAVTEKANAGTDTVISHIDYILGKEIENLQLMSGMDHSISGTGNKSNNALTGNESINTLNGKEGNDILAGGAGADIFKFDTKLNATTNVDTISDFISGSDDIHLSKKILSKYQAGDVLAADFVSGAGAAAIDSSDHFLYDTTTGALSYDADGSGTKSAAIQFATLTGAPTLVVSDLHIF